MATSDSLAELCSCVNKWQCVVAGYATEADGVAIAFVVSARWSAACNRPGRCELHVTLSAATVELVSTSASDSSNNSTSAPQQQLDGQQQQSQRKSDQLEKPIIVGDKPATNALLKRLETVCSVEC